MTKPNRSPEEEALVKSFTRQLIMVAVVESLVMTALVLLWLNDYLTADQFTIALMLVMVPVSGVLMFLMSKQKAKKVALKQQLDLSEQRPSLIGK
jgi:hypothetical protein